MNEHEVLTGVVLDEETDFSLVELSQVCGVSVDWLLTLIDEGVLEPEGTDQAHWRFHGACLRRIKIVRRLETDLGVNMPGAALALEMLDELEQLRRRLERLERLR